MAERTEITADRIVHLFPRTTRSHAARIAAYIDLRRDGESPFGAVVALGLSDVEKNPGRYEHWLEAVFDAIGLPRLPVKTTPHPFTADPFHSARRGL